MTAEWDKQLRVFFSFFKVIVQNKLIFFYNQNFQKLPVTKNSPLFEILHFVFRYLWLLQNSSLLHACHFVAATHMKYQATQSKDHPWSLPFSKPRCLWFLLSLTKFKRDYWLSSDYAGTFLYIFPLSSPQSTTLFWRLTIWPKFIQIIKSPSNVTLGPASRKVPS